MTLRLIFNDLSLPLDLPGTGETAEAVGVQIERCLTPGSDSGFVARLMGEIIRLLDADLHPPSQLETMIATMVAQDLDLPLPKEVLRYRGRTIEFTDRYQPIYIKRHKSGEPAA
jgi:hypothetical protein